MVVVKVVKSEVEIFVLFAKAKSRLFLLKFALHYIVVLEDDQWTPDPKLVVSGCCAVSESALRLPPAVPNPCLNMVCHDEK